MDKLFKTFSNRSLDGSLSSNTNSEGPSSPSNDSFDLNKTLRGLIPAPVMNVLQQQAATSKICALAHISELPQSVEDIFEKYPEHLPLINDALNELSQEKIAPLGAMLADNDVPPEDVRVLNQMFYNLLESQTQLGNLQFHTDSMRLLTGSQSDMSNRFLSNEQKTQELIQQDPNSQLAKQIAHAQQEAKANNLGDTRWIIGDRLPGLGMVTHAGWSGDLVPEDDQHPSLFYGIRTLGLSQGKQTSTTSVPLDFSPLGKIDRTTAEKLTEVCALTAEHSVDKTLTSSDLNTWMTKYDIPEDIQLNAKPIIMNFINDTQAAIAKLHLDLKQNI